MAKERRGTPLHSFRSRILATILVSAAVAVAVAGIMFFAVSRSRTIRTVADTEREMAFSMLNLQEKTELSPAEILSTVQSETLSGSTMADPPAEIVDELQTRPVAERLNDGIPVAYVSLRGQVVRIQLADSGHVLPDMLFRIGSAGVLFLFVFGVVSVIYTRRITRPMMVLRDASRRITEGDYTVRVDETAFTGESRELMESFNSMADAISRTAYLQKDFMNSISHEFRTPITSINGFARLLQSPEIFPEQRSEYVGYIAQESSRLSRLSETLLRLTSLEHQPGPGSVESFRLDEQIRGVILRMEPTWDSREISWSLRLDPVTVESDPEMLSQVWINLIQNAIKFSPQGSEIAITLTGGQQAEVCIADHGPGMDVETLRRIYEPFFQGDPSRGSSGIGLGLPLVRRILEILGGSIRARSAPGEGSEFRVTIPLRIQPDRKERS